MEEESVSFLGWLLSLIMMMVCWIIIGFSAAFGFAIGKKVADRPKRSKAKKVPVISEDDEDDEIEEEEPPVTE